MANYSREVGAHFSGGWRTPTSPRSAGAAPRGALRLGRAVGRGARARAPAGPRPARALDGRRAQRPRARARREPRRARRVDRRGRTRRGGGRGGGRGRRPRARVFLRIGYEFDNPDNAYYPPSSSPPRPPRGRARARAAAAARARARARGRPAASSRRCGTRGASRSRRRACGRGRVVARRRVVDWVGVSLFQQAYAAHGAGNRSATAGSRAGDDPHALNTHTWAFAERLGELARARAKALLVAEATPFGGLDCGGCARGADDEIWAAWFEPVFDFVARHDARALSYISCDWERGPMWRGMGWGDTRLDGPLADDAADGAAGVRARWRARLRDDPRYAAQGAAALARCFANDGGGGDDGSALGRPSSLPRVASHCFRPCRRAAARCSRSPPAGARPRAAAAVTWRSRRPACRRTSNSCGRSAGARWPRRCGSHRGRSPVYTATSTFQDCAAVLWRVRSRTRLHSIRRPRRSKRWGHVLIAQVAWLSLGHPGG